MIFDPIFLWNTHHIREYNGIKHLGQTACVRQHMPNEPLLMDEQQSINLRFNCKHQDNYIIIKSLLDCLAACREGKVCTNCN